MAGPEENANAAFSNESDEVGVEGGWEAELPTEANEAGPDDGQETLLFGAVDEAVVEDTREGVLSSKANKAGQKDGWETAFSDPFVFGTPGLLVSEFWVLHQPPPPDRMT